MANALLVIIGARVRKRFCSTLDLIAGVLEVSLVGLKLNAYDFKARFTRYFELKALV